MAEKSAIGDRPARGTVLVAEKSAIGDRPYKRLGIDLINCDLFYNKNEEVIPIILRESLAAGIILMRVLNEISIFSGGHNG